MQTLHCVDLGDCIKHRSRRLRHCFTSISDSSPIHVASRLWLHVSALVQDKADADESGAEETTEGTEEETQITSRIVLRALNASRAECLCREKDASRYTNGCH
jgi:hypothetical protein